MDHPLFRHTLEALRKAKEIEDEQMLDGTLIRVGHRRRPRDVDQITPRYLSRATNIDWWAPSPLVAFERNSTHFRIPTLLLTPISKVAVPRGAEGQAHPDYPDPQGSVEGHYSYIERQERAARSALQHGDYIEREEVRDVDELGDVAHICTNIHRSPEKRRAFARAVYKHERLGEIHELQAATDDLDWWEQRATQSDAPDWVKQGYRTLRKKAAERAREAAQKSKPLVPIYVPILKATERQAFDRITWCEAQPGWDRNRKNLIFKSGPGGRVQYRFVYQLPYWMTPAERLENVRKIARYLGKMGFMYVAAIHRPDPHNDPRNFHVHIDAYDRPCRYIKRLGKWDFEVAKKKRNGSVHYPHRQDKIAGFARSENGLNREEHGRKVLTDFRRTFCDITNEILERSSSALRYHPGPFEAIGVNLRATRKLGGKAMAAEAIGLRTTVGDANARDIWSDVFDAIHRDRSEAVQRVRGWAGEKADAIARIEDRAERDDLHKRLAIARDDELALIERRYRFELGLAEIRMMRSRAETVQRETTRRAAAKASNGAFRKSSLAKIHEAAPREAALHLQLIDGLTPNVGEIERERDAIATRWGELDAVRSLLGGEVKAASAKIGSAPSRAIRRLGPTVVAIDTRLVVTPATASMPSRFDRLEIDRLLAWFKKNGQDLERFSLVGTELTVRAPQAVCTRLIKHADKPAVLRALGDCIEQVRRAADLTAEAALSNPEVMHTQDVNPRSLARATETARDKRDGQERMRQLSRGPEAASAQRVDANAKGSESADISGGVSPKTDVRQQTRLTRPAVETDIYSPSAAVGGNPKATPARSSRMQTGGGRAAADLSPMATGAKIDGRGVEISSALSGVSAAPLPDYVLVDAEFVRAELAAGHNVDGDDLRFWRKMLTAENTSVLAAPDPADKMRQLYVEDHPIPIDIVSRRLVRAASDPQLSRYLCHMLPTLPAIMPGEIGLASVAMRLHNAVEAQTEIDLGVLDMAAKRRSGLSL